MELLKDGLLACGLMAVTLFFGFAVLYFAATAGGGVEATEGGSGEGESAPGGGGWDCAAIDAAHTASILEFPAETEGGENQRPSRTVRSTLN